MAEGARTPKVGRVPNSIRWHRLRGGLSTAVSQTELARRSGIPRWMLNRIERGFFLPTQNQVELIASVLGLTPADIYSAAALDLIRSADHAREEAGP